jgi:hypothetical protein
MAKTSDAPKVVWRKSSYSSVNGCIEVAFIDRQVAVRDSKDQHGPVLVFTFREWEAFLGGARAGQFEFPRTLQSESLR